LRAAAPVLSAFDPDGPGLDALKVDRYEEELGLEGMLLTGTHAIHNDIKSQEVEITCQKDG
jgi:hypothetical protein